MPHLIRLRGPWQWERLADGANAILPPATGEIDLSAGDWSQLAWDAGPLRLTRRFGRPTLPTGERVVLIVDSARPLREASLNGQPLVVHGAAQVRIDVTEQLAPRNELVVVLAGPPRDATAHLAAWLEIG